MSSQLFKNFIRKAVLSKQGPPGPAPRQGLQWKPQTHRWIRPKGSQEYDSRGKEVPEEYTLNALQSGRAQLANHFLDMGDELKREIRENSILGPEISNQLLEHLHDLSYGLSHAMARLTDTLHHLTDNTNINQYNSPTLIDLHQAVIHARQRETDSGLSESHIHGGHDVEEDQRWGESDSGFVQGRLKPWHR